MASTFHLGAYHELADTFTLGFEGGRKGEKERKGEGGKKSRIFSFFGCELPSFVLLPFFSLPPPRTRRDVTLLRSLPQMDAIYINNPPRFREHLIDVSLSKDSSQAFE